jgi:hypothetical protein
MYRRALHLILTFAALLACLSTPGLTGVWQCEGRACGTLAWRCCCDAPDETRDTLCSLSSRFPTSASGCNSECGCIWVTAETLPSRAMSAVVVTPPVLASACLPALSMLATALPAAPLRPGIEMRGPPLASTFLPPSGLRAPPLA